MAQFRTLIGVTPYERDPRVMPATFINSPAVYDGALTATTAAGFWTFIDNIGDYITTSPSGVTRTILNVTGRGRLVGVIGANVAAAGSTTFTITVDGVAYTYGPVSPFYDGNEYRLCLGDFLRHVTQNTVNNHSGGYSAASTARTSNIVSTVAAGSMVIRNPVHATRFIKFDTSLKVEIQTSSVGAQANSAYSGCIWNLDG